MAERAGGDFVEKGRGSKTSRVLLRKRIALKRGRTERRLSFTGKGRRTRVITLKKKLIGSSRAIPAVAGSRSHAQTERVRGMGGENGGMERTAEIKGAPCRKIRTAAVGKEEMANDVLDGGKR